MKVAEMDEVEAFMKKFTDENIEVIWGVSEDYALTDGNVKVTVLATGFGMKNIPEMKPVIKEEEEIKEKLTREEEAKRQAEEEQIKKMTDAFYEQDFRIYIYTGDEINDEEFIAAIDNSPTFNRSSHDLQQFKAKANAMAAAEKQFDND